MAGCVDVFEEAGLLKEFIMVLDYVDSTLAIIKRYGSPSVIAGTLVYDGLSMLDDFARGIADTLARRWTAFARSFVDYSTKSLEVNKR
jgi:hypothetical protein